MNNDKNEELKIKLDFIKNMVELIVPIILILALMKG